MAAPVFCFFSEWHRGIVGVGNFDGGVAVILMWGGGGHCDASDCEGDRSDNDGDADDADDMIGAGHDGLKMHEIHNIHRAYLGEVSSTPGHCRSHVARRCPRSCNSCGVSVQTGQSERTTDWI